MDKATVVSFPDEFAKGEIQELAKAAGYSVVDLITQKRILKSEYGVGVGKAQELKDIIARNGSRTLIVDDSLGSSQAFRLATVVKAEIVDRERLILNIFARRAQTTEAKLQVELAELKYEMPRARDAVRYSVSGERAGFMGMGESLVDVRFKALKRRMVSVQAKLARAQSSRALHRVERRKLGIPLVSFAGYTSSGKTTLFNRFASESREESPDLFTTLTTTTRAVSFADSRRRVMLSDTVGFISRLPTYMIESFKSTLEELTYADLVLLMVDASESAESLNIKLESCTETLGQLKVDSNRVILVLNKIDLLKDDQSRMIEANDIFDQFHVAKVSALKGDGLRQLKNLIIQRTYEADKRAERTLSPERGDRRSIATTE